MTAADNQTRTHTAAPGLVWIEDGDGTIVRGRVDSASAEGVHVHLSQEPAFGAGDEVALRICLQPGAPTFGTTGRIGWLRASADEVECGLEWSPSPEDRPALDAWLASAA